MYLQEKDVRKNLSVSVVWDVNHSVLQAKNIYRKLVQALLRKMFTMQCYITRTYGKTVQATYICKYLCAVPCTSNKQQVITTYVTHNISCFSYTAKQNWDVVRLEVLIHFAWQKLSSTDWTKVAKWIFDHPNTYHSLIGRKWPRQVYILTSS